jgi:hypothetical protein
MEIIIFGVFFPFLLLICKEKVKQLQIQLLQQLFAPNFH